MVVAQRRQLGHFNGFACGLGQSFQVSCQTVSDSKIVNNRRTSSDSQEKDLPWRLLLD